MRFVWLRTSSNGSDQPPSLTGGGRFLLVGYNVVWWVPVALPILGLVSYRIGALGFLLVTVTRAAVNLYRNNILPLDKGERFALRSP